METGFRPLEGTRVVELSTHVSGAYCGRLLADLGGSVTRVTFPWSGYAQLGVRPYLRAALDRGKEVLDPDAVSGLRELMAVADVVVSDLSPSEDLFDTVEPLLKDLRADQVLVEISSFGADEPYARWAGTSLTVGAWAAANWSIGDPAREPLSVPFDIPESLSGVHAAGLALLGLIQRGDGAAHESARMQIATADLLGYVTGMIVKNFIPFGRGWRRDGPRATESGGCYPGAIFACSDGPALVMCRQPQEWKGLVAAMGFPQWAEDERFHDPRVVARLHADEADLHVIPWIADHTIAEMMDLGAEYGFPVGPLRPMDGVLKDEQFLYRRFFEDFEDHEVSVRVPGRPYKVIDGPAPTDGPVPLRPGPRSAPLSALRVLDLTWVWSGPMVTSGLRDLGADVVKVEHGSHPDPARARGRGLRDGVPVAGPALEVSPYFNQLGHGKKSVAIDMTSDGGRDLILELARHCDVVIENMRPGVMSRRGIGFEELIKVNPGVILVSMSTMGQSGPSSQMMGYGVVMSGLAGLEPLVGYEDEPMGLFNLALSDPIAGSHALMVLLAALLRRQQTGRGAWVDLSQTECTVAVLTEPILESQLLGSVVTPGNNYPDYVLQGHYRCVGEDAWIAVSIRTAAEADGVQRLLTACLGRPSTVDLAVDLREWLASCDVGEATRLLRDLGIAVSPVNSFEALEASGWYTDRGFAATLDHPYLGPNELVGLPWRVGGRGPTLDQASPLLGQHTKDVLTSLVGLSDIEIMQLASSGAITVRGEEDSEH